MVFLIVAVLRGGDARAETIRAQDATGSGRPPLQTVAAEEDWSYLADPTLRSGPFDRMKYIPLGRGGGYVSFGGEVREYYEHYGDEALGAIPGTSDYLRSRILFHADAHASPNFRAYVNLQSAFIAGRPGGGRPSIDEDALDLLEGFLEWRTTQLDDHFAAPRFVVRIGRQQVDFGAGRLFSSRSGPNGEGPNVLQGLDGVRLVLRARTWKFDAFGFRPTDTQPGIFDDGWLEKQGTWGLYATRDRERGLPGVDAYYFGTQRPNAAFFGSDGFERRHTAGARIWERSSGYDYDAEGFYQFGTLATKTIRAWGYGASAGRSFIEIWGKPRIGLQGGQNSGGGDSGTVGQQYAPFPRGGYFGNLTALGPTNTTAAQGQIDVHPVSSLTLSLGLYLFWRTTLTDGVYSIGGIPLAPPNNESRFIGYQPTLFGHWAMNDYVSLSASYETLRRGGFLLETPGTKATTYVAAWTTVRF